MDKKLAYLPMAVDMVHPGHLNIINTAVSLGATVMVGCYSDEAIASYKRLPFMNYEQRKAVIESIKGVDIVIEQRTRDLEENIRKYKPHYVVHGTDWKDGALSGARERTIKILKEWGGEIVEPEYTTGISSTVAHVHLKQIGTTPAERNGRLRKLLNVKRSLKAMQVHDAISALTVENAILERSGKPTEEFDAFWLNEHILSLSKGKYDNTFLDISLKRNVLNDIFDITTRPLIFDGGTIIGFKQFAYTIKVLERLGVSAITIEDNGIDDIYEKIRVGKKNQLIRDFMIIAKIKDSFLELPYEELMKIIKNYIDASIDAIMLTYRNDTVNTIIYILNEIKRLKINIPIFILTDTYTIEIDQDLLSEVPHCIVYNSHMLSVAYNAMKNEVIDILDTENFEHKVDISREVKLIESVLPHIYTE